MSQTATKVFYSPIDPKSHAQSNNSEVFSKEGSHCLGPNQIRHFEKTITKVNTEPDMYGSSEPKSDFSGSKVGNKHINFEKSLCGAQASADEQS